jgi:hypothetical protein
MKERIPDEEAKSERREPEFNWGSIRMNRLEWRRDR